MGKPSKQRLCPAVSRAITPAECGENRGSRYACPLDCDAVRARMLRAVGGLLARDVGASDAARQFLAGTRQPAFTEVVLDHFLRNVGRLPKQSRPNEAAQATMTLALRTAVDELDQALRG